MEIIILHEITLEELNSVNGAGLDESVCVASFGALGALGGFIGGGIATTGIGMGLAQFGALDLERRLAQQFAYLKDSDMNELNLDEISQISGGDCMSNWAVGGGITGGVIGGVAGFVGGFGFGAGPGITGGSSLGSAIGTIGGAYFCYP
ncbi:hypothetical protein [Alteromonas lipotrueiana]|uniref:hypothetical protein n=1 Tax=Alteromonas lipotrueiana TaxID=2803815 RepID=UPI001C45E665|nr:hypothetical protein [Alteromonas lipotrueiana]